VLRERGSPALSTYKIPDKELLARIKVKTKKLDLKPTKKARSTCKELQGDPGSGTGREKRKI